MYGSGSVRLGTPMVCDAKPRLEPPAYGTTVALGSGPLPTRLPSLPVASAYGLPARKG